MYIPWRAPVPPGHFRALAKVARDVEAHVDANYPFQQTPDFPMSIKAMSDLSKERRERSQGDPVVERAVDTVIAIVRVLLPPEIRFTLNSGDDHVRERVRHVLLEVDDFKYHPERERSSFKHWRDSSKVKHLLGSAAAAFKDSLEG
jgi:hypothetical protein